MLLSFILLIWYIILIKFHTLNNPSFLEWILGISFYILLVCSYFVKDFFVSVPEGYCFVIFFSCDVLSNFGFIE